jgi:YHS domain-containing protein
MKMAYCMTCDKEIEHPNSILERDGGKRYFCSPYCANVFLLGKKKADEIKEQEKG